MAPLERLLHLLFAAYALGLIVYMILNAVRKPQAEKVRLWLERFYLPLLIPLRAMFKPVRFGSTNFDLSPMVLMACIVAVRAVIFYVFFGHA